MNTIVFTGGGTAGHVSPNLALAPYFLDDEFEIHYIGSYAGIEREMVKHPIIYHGISTGKLRRYFDVKNFTDPFRICNGYFQSVKLLKRINPKIIFSKGGFVSVPVCLAAKHLKIPVVLHESDLTPGLANKLCIPYCKVICTSFEKTLEYTKDKGVLTGTPIRRELFSGNKHYAKTLLKTVDESKPTLLIMGGSLGSLAINECIRQNINELTQKYNVIHICGKGNLIKTQITNYFQFEFISNELADMIALSDFVVSRSGATSIFEFLALKKPMLLIPLPASASRGDQILNANYFNEKGYAKVLQQENMNKDTLLEAINNLYNNINTIKSCQSKCKTPNSNKHILEIIKENMI